MTEALTLVETKETLKVSVFSRDQKFQVFGIRIWELDLHEYTCIYTAYTQCVYVCVYIFIHAYKKCTCHVIISLTGCMHM